MREGAKQEQTGAQNGKLLVRLEGGGGEAVLISATLKPQQSPLINTPPLPPLLFKTTPHHRECKNDSRTVMGNSRWDPPDAKVSSAVT